MHDKTLLLLVQHGDAVAEAIDPLRPLSEQGRRDVQTLADFLVDRGVRVGRILHSGKTRARETAEILAAGLLSQGDPESVPGLKPKDSPQEILAALAGQQGNLMICSHMPLLAKLVSSLVTGSENLHCAAFAPGTLVALQRDDAEAWSISFLLPAALLRAG